MKKIFYFILAAAAIVASCAKEPVSEPVSPSGDGSSVFTGTIIQPGGIGEATKVSIIDQTSDLDNVYIKWTQNDQIYIIKRGSDRWVPTTVADGPKVFEAASSEATTEFTGNPPTDWIAPGAIYEARYYGKNDVWKSYVLACDAVTPGDPVEGITINCNSHVEAAFLENMPLSCGESQYDDSNFRYNFTFSNAYAILQINVPSKLDFEDLYVCVTKGGQTQDVHFTSGDLTLDSEYTLCLKDAHKVKETEKYTGQEYVSYFVPVTAGNYGKLTIVAAKNNAEVARMETYAGNVKNDGQYVLPELYSNNIYPFVFCNTLTIGTAGEYQLESNNGIDYKVNIAADITTDVTINAEADGKEPANIYINNRGHQISGKLTINASKSHVEGEEGIATEVEAHTSNSTFVVKPTLTITGLTVKKGSVVVEGTADKKANVETITIPSDVDEQIKIDVTGVSAEATTDRVKIVNKSNVETVVVVPETTGDNQKSYVVDKSGDNKDVTEVSKETVAMIGTTTYETLAAAIAAVPTDGTETTITMVNDFATTEKVTIAATQNIVLDLNGKKVSYTTDGYGSFIENKGQLKIKDSGPTGIITAEFSAPNWSAGCYTIDNFGASPASKLVIESGTIENTSPAGLAWPINNGSWGTSADLVINGGTIHSTNYVPVREYLQYGGKKTIVINGGKLISDNSRAIAVQLNDAEVADQGSYVEINGGEFSCNGSGILYVDLHAANLNTAGFTMTVNGGKFKNANTSAPVLIYDDEGNTQTSAVLLSNVLKGGVYSKKPADEIVADKYIVAENSDATYPWKVVISPDAVTVANIGTTEYYSLSDALTAAKEGEAVYIIPAQLEETVSASNDNNIQLILDGKAIVGDIAFGGKGTLIVRAEELNKDYYSYPKAYEVDAPTIPAQGVGGIMGKISATDDATVMLRENLYSGPFEGNVELRGGFYYSGLGLDNIKAQTPSGIGLVVDQVQNVQGYDMYYVPEVPESYLVHIPAEFLAAGLAGQLTPEEIQQATLGYWLNEDRLLNPVWVSLTEDGSISLNECPKAFPDDVYAFFTNLKDNDSENPKYAYQNWVCDFVISYSQPIAEDYKSGIWGYYSEMGFGCWLPKSATNNPVGLMRSTFGPWAYSKMLSTVGMFLCGPKNLNPADAGKVITVELNIYPDSETDKCITTNKVVYTIPAISE